MAKNPFDNHGHDLPAPLCQSCLCQRIWQSSHDARQPEVDKLQRDRDALLKACKCALHDMTLINETIAKTAKVHPFTITPAVIGAAIRQAEEGQ